MPPVNLASRGEFQKERPNGLTEKALEPFAGVPAIPYNCPQFPPLQGYLFKHSIKSNQNNMYFF